MNKIIIEIIYMTLMSIGGFLLLKGLLILIITRKYGNLYGTIANKIFNTLNISPSIIVTNKSLATTDPEAKRELDRVFDFYIISLTNVALCLGALTVVKFIAQDLINIWIPIGLSATAILMLILVRTYVTTLVKEKLELGKY